MEQMRWRCTVCGEIFEGEAPPAPCPVCGAGADAFEPVAAPAVRRWKCTVCGQVFEGEAPPAPCPVCGAGADAFVPLEEKTGGAVGGSDSRFVIVGGGGAGLAAAKAIREQDGTAKVTLVCGEGIIPYNRPGLSRLVAEGAGFESVALEPYGWYEARRIELVCDARVERVDPDRREALLSDGRALPYTALLLATGANAFCPVKGGAGAPPVRVLRSFADASALVEAVRPGARALVVGGGILGLEAAMALYRRGARVRVVELAERVLSIQADPFASGRIEQALRALGMEFDTGVSVSAVEADGAHLSDGRVLPTELVLVSAGIRSELDLARGLGLALGRGICVDASMKTSLPGIYAAGDCAEFEGRVAGLWGAALEMGRTAGRAMCGCEAVYRPPVPATAFEAPGISLFAVGSVNGEGLQAVERRDDEAGVYRKLALRDGRLVGVLMLGRPAGGAAAVAAVERGAALDEALPLLQQQGEKV